MLPTASVVSHVNNRLSGEHELRQTESHTHNYRQQQSHKQFSKRLLAYTGKLKGSTPSFSRDL